MQEESKHWTPPVGLKPNYNDDPDPAVLETVEKLVDTSKVIELEVIDPEALPKRYLYRFIKRAFDIVSCSCALVICAVPMLVIAVMVKMDSPGPVFYRQERLGKGGKPIKVVKFRSMYVDAEARGAQWAQGDDPRVTPIGKKIRANRMAPVIIGTPGGGEPTKSLSRSAFSLVDLHICDCRPVVSHLTSSLIFPMQKLSFAAKRGFAVKFGHSSFGFGVA